MGAIEYSTGAVNRLASRAANIAGAALRSRCFRASVYWMSGQAHLAIAAAVRLITALPDYARIAPTRARQSSVESNSPAPASGASDDVSSIIIVVCTGAAAGR